MVAHRDKIYLRTDMDSRSDRSDRDLQEFEYDGIEIMLSPDDLQIVLTHNCTRFILAVVRPTDPKQGDVLAKWFRKLEDSENEPDEMAYDRCLEELRDSAISACKDKMYTLSSSVPVSRQERQSLENFLYPMTFCLQLFSEQGALRAYRIHDTAKYVKKLEPATLPRNLLSRPTSALTLASDLDFIEDLYMGQVLKVSKNGELCVFKSAHNGAKNQLMREIKVLQQISDRWEPGHPARPAVPRLLGLVGSHDQVIGILEDFVDGDKLSELDINEVSPAQRRDWRRQIERTMTLLHQHGFIWGDVKADNVLVDKDNRPWLIDFGGSRTEGWVEEHLAETREGDIQGLRQLVKYLGLRK
jgi:hypothetical protein